MRNSNGTALLQSTIRIRRRCSCVRPAPVISLHRHPTLAGLRVKEEITILLTLLFRLLFVFAVAWCLAMGALHHARPGEQHHLFSPAYGTETRALQGPTSAKLSQMHSDPTNFC